MLPTIQLHRPRGFLPKLDVRKKTVVDYQPSWLLVAVPAVAALAARRRSSGSDSKAAPAQERPADSPPVGVEERTGRRRRAIVVITRIRRRPGTVGVEPYGLNGQQAGSPQPSFTA